MEKITMRRKAVIKPLHFVMDGYTFSVEVWTSLDGGKTWYYCGIGKYAKTEDDANRIADEYCNQTVWHGLNGDEEIIWEKVVS